MSPEDSTASASLLPAAASGVSGWWGGEGELSGATSDGDAIDEAASGGWVGSCFSGEELTCGPAESDIFEGATSESGPGACVGNSVEEEGRRSSVAGGIDRKSLP